ncbi:MAG: hypothetical protein EXS39_00190 [Opitutaceae bacterium]|nr:hypothetical protein [Opitutaceae bacterium]
MIFFLVAVGLLLHILVWGAGLALLVTPRPWRRFWPVLTAPAGLALQSAVVWVGAHTSVAGTDVYARWSLLVPGVLLAVGLGRCRVRALGTWVRLWPLWVLMVAVLVWLVVPLGFRATELTTTSIGSCDAADYAAGMRVFKEFSSRDRSGYIGQTEVAGVLEVDNFFDHWMVLNHFTPSALLALNGSIFGLRPHQITGVFTMVLAVLVMPGVWLLARSALRYRRWVALLAAVLVGASPLLLYAVYQVATAQIIAVGAVNLLTWSALKMLQRSGNGRSAAAWAPLLGLSFWLILGSYNFFIVVCGAPLAGAVSWWVLRRKAWRRVGVWLAVGLASLVAAGLFGWERVRGLGLRFLLFDQVAYGWPMPILGPAGWAGHVVSAELAPGNSLIAAMLGGVLAVAWGWALVKRARRNEPQAWMVAGLTLLPLLGYGLLALKNPHPGINASYDAYKLLAVFHGCVLTGMLAWLGWAPIRGGTLIKAGALALIAATIHSGWLLRARAAAGPMRVEPELAAVAELERRPEIRSINILAPDMWTRLWANALLLRRPQFFSDPTYEGRRPTPLRGEWDLCDGLFSVKPGTERGYFAVGKRLYALQRGDAGYLRLRPGAGWHEPEQHARKPERWIWTKGNSSLVIENPHLQPLGAICRLQARSLEPRNVQLWADGRLVGTAGLGLARQAVQFPAISILPGKTLLELRSPAPPTAVHGDARLLGICVYCVEIEVRADRVPSPP